LFKNSSTQIGLPLEQMLRYGRLNGHDVLLLLLLVLLLVRRLTASQSGFGKGIAVRGQGG
jgi:hypothetical protein